MNSETAYIAFRVAACCIVFLCFLFVPFKNRFRYSYIKTALLAFMLTFITVVLTVLFLTPGNFFVTYSTVGIILWLIMALTICQLAIRGSFFEVLFVVLVNLNLYVDLSTIAKIIVIELNLNVPFELARTWVTLAVLLAYVPFIWLLMVKLYGQMMEFNIKFSFWRFIWVIPALTYMIFFVKIINDYWRHPVEVMAKDVVFIILWSFTSYVFFYVTMQMLIQTYKGMTAKEETHLISSQLNMQEERYTVLLDYIENNARVRHDWRHQLLSIRGFAETGNVEELQNYLKELFPAYLAEGEKPFCLNHTVDIILQHNVAFAKTKGITMTVSANVRKSIAIPDTDLCIIFGNLMENAMEACIKQTGEEKLIDIKADMKGHQLVLLVKNTYSEHVIVKKNIYYSTKREAAGIGLASVQKVVEKYNGVIKIEYDQIYFSVYVLLNTGSPE